MRKLKMQYTWMLAKQTEKRIEKGRQVYIYINIYIYIYVWTYWKHKTQWAQGYVTKKHKTVNFNETLHFAVWFSRFFYIFLLLFGKLFIYIFIWYLYDIYFFKVNITNNKYVELKNQKAFSSNIQHIKVCRELYWYWVSLKIFFIMIAL